MNPNKQTSFSDLNKLSKLNDSQFSKVQQNEYNKASIQPETKSFWDKYAEKKSPEDKYQEDLQNRYKGYLDQRNQDAINSSKAFGNTKMEAQMSAYNAAKLNPKYQEDLRKEQEHKNAYTKEYYESQIPGHYKYREEKPLPLTSTGHIDWTGIAQRASDLTEFLNPKMSTPKYNLK